jgi:lipopolysaccharide/colanic/teichoic acid biosynthesis glycosyltransferase/energy-coupling factor transporter ATP-binding protein EcfA2
MAPAGQRLQSAHRFGCSAHHFEVRKARMANEHGPTRRLTTIIIALALIAGVPAAAIYRIRALQHDLPLEILAVILYEIVVIIVGFVVAVSADLRSRWTSRVAESIDSWLRRKVSRFTRSYLRYVQAYTRYMDTKGFSTAGPHTLEMADILVTLSLSSMPLHSLSSDPVRPHVEPEDSSSKTIWHWMNEAQRKRVVLSIVGPPGSGKTTLLRHVAFTLAKGSRHDSVQGVITKIPILINLREHKSTLFDDSFVLADLLRKSLLAVGHPVPPSWIEVNLRHGKFAILLDGLDEIADQAKRAALTDWLSRQSSAQDGNLFVLTSRPFGYSENPVSNAMVVEVQALAEKQISSFVSQWYYAISARSHGADNESSRLAAKIGSAELLTRLDQTPSLFELTANPLLLTMLVNVHYYRPGALPRSRAELYDEICDVFLAKRDQARLIRVDVPGPQKRAVLQILAYEMACREVTEAKAVDAFSWISAVLDRISDRMEPAEFLQNIENSSGLLAEKERGVYSFTHLTFQEYLTAEFLRDKGRVDEIVGKVTSPWWRETVRLYAAISDATPLINACLRQKEDPDLVVLGVQCAEEANVIDKEARRAVSDCINPPNARDNITARHTAARARLQLRTSKEVSLRKGSFIGGSYVTWLEYQYFIDSLSSVECVVPDHWSTGIYPLGADNEPAVGIRYTDSTRFCEWLGAELQSPFRIRLPRASEIDKALELSAEEAHLRRLAYWTVTQLPRSRDGRFWPLMRDLEEGGRKDTYPLPKNDITRQELNVRVEDDLNWLYSSQAQDDPTAIANERPIILLPAAPAAHVVPLSELLDRSWADSFLCDAGQIQRDIRLAQTLIQHYMSSDRLTGEEGKVQDRLAILANRLCDSSAVALDRQRYSDRNGAEIAQLRNSARRTALEAAMLCAKLHVAHGGNISLPELEKVTRPTRRVPNPSRLPTVAMNILAHALIGIYIDLIILSARIEGKAIPAESLLYVREVQSVGRDELLKVDQAPRPAPSLRMRLFKNVFDRCVAAAALILLAPVFGVFAILIRLDDGGPILYTQIRVGKDGRVFRLYKFRTMVVDAEQRKAELMARNDLDGILFKLRHDPRVTRVGGYLRRWSFDELPQLFNVFLGDMSVVGPRPALPDEVVKYSEYVRRRLSVKPGLTGLWQVSGRSDLSWDESVRLDLLYAENWSFMLDLQILWRTIWALRSGEGVY